MNSNELLQVIVLPIVFLLLGLISKRLGRRDGDDSPKINDWAIGTTIILMAFAKMMGDLVEYDGGNKAGISPVWCLLILLTLLFVSLYNDRFHSWKIVKQGRKITYEKKLVEGIIIPGFVSIITFVIYQLLKILLYE